MKNKYIYSERGKSKVVAVFLNQQASYKAHIGKAAVKQAGRGCRRAQGLITLVANDVPLVFQNNVTARTLRQAMGIFMVPEFILVGVFTLHFRSRNMNQLNRYAFDEAQSLIGNTVTRPVVLSAFIGDGFCFRE